MRFISKIRVAALAVPAGTLGLPALALADCSTSGTTVTCTGTTSGFSTTTADTAITVNSGATVVGPLAASGDGSTLTNAGTIYESSAVYAVQMGDDATVTNTGTISSTSSSSGAGAISVGADSTVYNHGSLTAESGTYAVSFGSNGTFYQESDATAELTGNINFGTNTGSNIASLYNYDTTYGIYGNVYASGNVQVYNDGIFEGNFYQTAVAGSSTVTFDNGSAATYVGIIQTGNNTTLTNEGTMYLYSGSVIGSYYSSGTDGTSSVTNSGTLYVGTVSAPAALDIYGDFTQTSAGTLNMAISGTGSAGTTYSQIYTSGTATLSGTLNINTSSGYVADSTVYKLIDAVGGISGNFTSVTYNGNSSSLFLDWDIIGAVSSGSGSEQYYEVSATHTGYANAMRSNGGTNNQIAVASGLDPLISIANADTTSGEATLLGEVDALNLAQAKVFLNSVSPEGYLAYATALRDQANMFARTVDQRMTDQNSKHPEDGWWFTTMAQFDFASTASTQGGYRTRDHMFGLAAGYDLSGPNHVIGLATSISWDSLHYALNSLNGTNRDWAVALYGAQNFGRLRLYGQIAYNMGHLSTTKTITIGDYTWTANARAPEHLFKATANLGYTWSLGQYKLEPFGGIDFNSGRVAGFTEYNAGAADLTVSAMSASHTDVLAGVNVTRNKGIFRPYFKMAYRRQLTGDRNTVSAYFDGQSSGTFSVTGLPVGRDEIDPSAGINWVFDDAGSLYVGYQGTIRSNYNSEGINLGIRLEF